MQPTERELRVFISLSQGGEAEVLYHYIERVRQQMTNDLVDGNPTEVDIQAAKQSRAVLKELQNRLLNRDIIQAKQDQFS